jgi:hypothetical protein
VFCHHLKHVRRTATQFPNDVLSSAKEIYIDPAALNVLRGNLPTDTILPLRNNSESVPQNWSMPPDVLSVPEEQRAEGISYFFSLRSRSNKDWVNSISAIIAPALAVRKRIAHREGSSHLFLCETCFLRKFKTLHQGAHPD